MNEQELQLAVIGYIMATKKQPKSEQEVQAIAQEVASMKQSNPKQYQQLVQMGQQAQQQQAGAKVAALGSKLNYIKKIKGLCPEGEELVYMKQGGRVCPVCQKKAEKAESGKKLKEMNEVQKFKAQKAQKGSKGIEKNDTIHHNKQVYDLTGKHKQFKKLTNKDYRNLPTEKQASVDNKDMMRAKDTEKKACGGKTKKK